MPEDEKHYPWQAELSEWDRAERAKLGDDLPPIDLTDLPPAKFSDVRRCIAEARAKPEIWKRFVDAADRGRQGNPLSQEESHDLGAFVGSLTSWFRRKNNLQDQPTPYASIQRNLYRNSHARSAA
jgi:hypothetical protein